MCTCGGGGGTWQMHALFWSRSAQWHYRAQGGAPHRSNRRKELRGRSGHIKPAKGLESLACVVQIKFSYSWQCFLVPHNYDQFYVRLDYRPRRHRVSTIDQTQQQCVSKHFHGAPHTCPSMCARALSPTHILLCWRALNIECVSGSIPRCQPLRYVSIICRYNFFFACGLCLTYPEVLRSQWPNAALDWNARLSWGNSILVCMCVFATQPRKTQAGVWQTIPIISLLTCMNTEGSNN